MVLIGVVKAIPWYRKNHTIFRIGYNLSHGTDDVTVEKCLCKS